jgi:deoxyhypusine synthase
MLLEKRYDRFYDTVAGELDYRRMEELIGEYVETSPETASTQHRSFYA